MANSEEDQLLAGAFHAIMDKIQAHILQIEKKWKWIFIHQACFFRKIPAINANFAPTKVRAASMLLSEVWAKYKGIPTEILKHDARANSC